MKAPLISDTELRQVVNSVIEAAIDGDIKAAGLVFSYFLAKPKPRQAISPYKSIGDVRDAYHLGIITSEEVISIMEAMELLNAGEVINDDLVWDDNMRDYITNFNKKLAIKKEM